MISILKRDSTTCHNVLSCVGGTKINTRNHTKVMLKHKDIDCITKIYPQDGLVIGKEISSELYDVLRLINKTEPKLLDGALEYFEKQVVKNGN